MATRGQYNNQYSHVQASNYPLAPGPTRSRSSPQYGHGYGYQPLHGHPQEQDYSETSMAYGQARENNAHTYANHHTPVAPQPKPRTKLSQEGRNMTEGVSYNTHNFGQQAPIQSAQDQRTNQGPLDQTAVLETLSGQDTKLEKNNTGEITYSEGNDSRDDQTKEAADVIQGQKPKIHTQLLTLAVEPREMITENRSYHNEISGIEAIKRLKVFRNCCYLTRYSEIQKCYILSVCMSDEDLQNEIYKHFELKVSDEGIRILEHRPFANLVELLTHYENNRLGSAFPTIGKCITLNAYRERVREKHKRQPQQVHLQLHQEQQAQPQQQTQQAPIQAQQQARLQRAQIQAQIREHQVQIQEQQTQLQKVLQQQLQAQKDSLQQAQIQTQVQEQQVEIKQQQGHLHEQQNQLQETVQQQQAQLQQQAQQIQALQQRKCKIF
ncbi:uncharacterized protein LOC135334501 isoform X2 [Halichondria panicea]|uniref:uncharacterized protein LOC135334501 isoform X2 n=1 Tax=Halichondria panicea TaxID=6063 RepID=UPI00312B68EA